MRPHRRSEARRQHRVAEALLALLIATALGFTCRSAPLDPRPGVVDYQAVALIPVPGGVVNAAGGNLIVERTDLSIDTRLGTREIGATWNGADRAWRWSFESTFDGTTFSDPSGAVYDVSGLVPGDVIPGSVWVRHAGDAIRSVGGLVHEFGPDGGLRVLRWASSDHPRLEYVSQTVAGKPRIVRIDQCAALGSCALLFTISRDAQGRAVRIDDRAGRSAEFVWDADGQLAVARDGLDVAQGWPGRRYEYVDGRLTAVVSSEGERIEYRWVGPRPAEVEQVGGEHPIHRFTYLKPAAGLYATRYEDPTGVVTTLRFDTMRRVREQENAFGERSLRTWDGRRPASVTRPDGVTTTFQWADGLLATRVEPNGNGVRFTWARGATNRAAPFAPPLARVEDDLGILEERLYDAAGRLVQVVDGAGESVSYAWDSEEMLASVTSRAGLDTTFHDYGEHGHPTRVEGPLGATDLLYDAVGNLLRGPDASPPAGPGLGGIVSRSFDADRNVASLVLREDGGLAIDRTLVRVLRSDGRPTAILRPYGGDVLFVYDAVGRLVERSERASGTPHADWQAAVFARDPAGRLLSLTRPNGMEQAWTYDAAGRLATHRILRDGVLEGQADYAWRDGRLESVGDSLRGGVETRTYDGFGRLFGVTHADGGFELFVYDARSRLVSRTLSDPALGFQRTLGVGYDAAGRPVRLDDQGVPLVERVFQGGRLTSVTTANGWVRSFAYDPGTGLPSSVTALDGADQLVESTTATIPPFCFAAACLRTETRSFGALVATSVEEFHLLSSRPGGFDGFEGLRIRVWATSSDATLNSRTSIFDAQGGLVEQQASFSTPQCGTLLRSLHRFDYNPEHNRLLRIRWNACGGVLHDYAWDEAGYAESRNGAAIGWDGAGRVSSVGEDRFVWDTRGRPVSRTLGGVERRLRFGGAVEADAAGVPVALDLGDVRIDLGSGARAWRHHDFRHNVKLVSDDAGRVVAHYRYSAFGLDRVWGGADPDEQFARGRPLGGLVLLGHRLYDPVAGRFLAPDPVYQWIDQHTYAQGNPVLFWDPSGALPSPLGAGFGASALTGAAIGASALAPLGPVAAAIGGLTGGLVGASLFGLAVQMVSPPEAARFTLDDLLEATVPVVEPSGGGGPDASQAGDRAVSGSSSTRSGAGGVRVLSGSIGIGPARWHGPPSRRPPGTQPGSQSGATWGDFSGGDFSGGAGAGGCYAPTGRAATPDLSPVLLVLAPLTSWLAWRVRRDRRQASLR